MPKKKKKSVSSSKTAEKKPEKKEKPEKKSERLIEEPSEKSVEKSYEKLSENKSVERVLLENTVALQRVIVNLSIKLDSLSDRISKLLELFEASAKSFSDRQSEPELGGKAIAQKIDSLLEQNKTLAKGIALMYDQQAASGYSPQFPPSAQQQPQPPVPQSYNTTSEGVGSMNLEGYQSSPQMGKAADVSGTSTSQKFKTLPKRENA